MRTVLFYLPEHLFGWPVFGWGLLLAVWLLVSAVILAINVRRQGWSADTLGYLPLVALVATAIVFVLPTVSEPGYGLPVRGYGVLMLAGIVSGVALALHRAQQRGIDPEHIYSLAFWVVACGVVGARAYYVIKAWDEFQRPDTWREKLIGILNVTQGGLVVYGALFGAAAAFLVYAYRHRLPVLTVADIVTPSMMIGLALGRVGCFLNGCCFGGECEVPWLAVRFPWQSPPYLQHVEQGRIQPFGILIEANDRGEPIIAQVSPGSLAEAQGLKPGERILMVGASPVRTPSQVYEALFHNRNDREVTIVTAGNAEPRQTTLSVASEKSLPIHPAQLYATVGALLVALLLLAYEPYQRADGELFALFLLVYPALRIAEEMLRRDEPTYAGLKVAQWISVALIVVGGTLLGRLRQPGRLAVTAPRG